MDNETRKILQDILICIENIENYVGANKIFVEYDRNMLLQDAVERNIITIGEAVNNLLKKNPSIEISNARKIVDARNRLTHGYDEVDNMQVWNIIVNHLPILRFEVEIMIK
jgi:uncharacterized protein with HEPN domain